MTYRPAVRSLPNERPERPAKSFVHWLNGTCVYKLRLALAHFGFARLLTRLSSQFILLNQKRSLLDSASLNSLWAIFYLLFFIQLFVVNATTSVVKAQKSLSMVAQGWVQEGRVHQTEPTWFPGCRVGQQSLRLERRRRVDRWALLAREHHRLRHIRFLVSSRVDVNSFCVSIH